jgi:predicted dehydrogenase
MAIAHDHGAVKTVVACFPCRNNFDLSGDEVILLNVIFIFQEFENVCLDRILLLIIRNGADQKIELFGTKAGLNLDPFTLYTDCNDMLADIKIRGNVGCGDFFTEEIRNFLDAIEGKAKCKAPAEDGVELMRILDAIYESAATGKSVDIVR